MNAQQNKINLNGKSPRSGRQSPEENPYYIGIARRFKLAKYITVIFLVLYLLFMIAFFRDEITIENFRYFIKYLDTSSPEYTKETRTIYYDPSTTLRLGVFKGDLAVISGSSANLYNMIGSKILSYDLNYPLPILVSSKKYMLIYSQGGYSYTINNAFSKLHSETYQFPITGAAVSDNGMYALISKTMEYRSVAYIYDKNFNLISQIMKDKLIMGIAFTPDENEILIMSIFNNNGDFATEILTLNPYSDTPKVLLSLDGTYGINAGYHSDKSFTVICDSKILFYNNSGELTGSYNYTNSSIAAYQIADDYTAMVFHENIVGNNNEVILFDTSGKIIFQETFYGHVSSVTLKSTHAYIVFSDNIAEIDIAAKTSKTAGIEMGCINGMLKDDDSIIVCYSQHANTFTLTELFGVPGSGGEE